jgi:hypothetical protein
VVEDRDIHILTYTHDAAAKGTSCNEQGNAKQPLIVEEYHPVCHTDKGDMMANSYSISNRT